MPAITYLKPEGRDLVGFIPDFLDFPGDTAKERLNAGYSHGGGWRPMQGWSFCADGASIKYPGDPAYKPVAKIIFGAETIYIYHLAWVAIVQSDGTFEVSRMD
jgi:hypothetical protein